MPDLFPFPFMANMVLAQMANTIVIFDRALAQPGDEQRHFIIQYFHEAAFDGVTDLAPGFACRFQCAGLFIEETVFTTFCSDGNVARIQRRYNWRVVFQHLKFTIRARHFN